MARAEHPDFREAMPFLGGALWIDLLNTTPVIGGQARDLIRDADALRRWSALAGIEGEAAPDDAAPARLRQMRAVLRDGFAALAQGRPLPEVLVAQINAQLAHVQVELAVEPDPDAPAGLALHSRETASGDALAVAVALDFARYLAWADPSRLRHCANPACTIVFHDHGKNNRRRWCSMAACGNRDKVASHRARKRGTDGTATV